MAKISIIVPVYNVEKYLRECLDSLINQTFKDIEIVCVNDGSTDNSLNILEEYAAKDNRVKVFSQKNQGVSAARNLGLSKITGEYLFFVDSDDWIKLETCEKLYETALEKQADIILFSHYNFYNGSFSEERRISSFIDSIGDKTITLMDSPVDVFLTPKYTWGKLYKKRLIDNVKIVFPEDIKCCEDRVFYVHACLYAKAITALNLPFYCYRIDVPNSLSKDSSISLPNMYLADQKIKELIYKTKNIPQKEIYKCFLENASTVSLLFFWNNFSNRFSKGTNIKYLLKQLNQYKIFSKKEKRFSASYGDLKSTVQEYYLTFIKKFFEPIIEIEKRRSRFVIYLFEKQVLNLAFRDFYKYIYGIRYFITLIKLKFIAKKRKIRVGLWVTENSKWTSLKSLYNALSEDEAFEPFVLLSYPKTTSITSSKQKNIDENIDFFEKNKIKYELAYNSKYNRYLSLDEFKPDIIFYQQPWLIHQNQSIYESSKTALTCYLPYCYYSINTNVNYLYGFHGCLWKYFVETNMHKNDYKKHFKATNCVAIGSGKLDNYKYVNDKNIWSYRTKKRLIYSPHHTFAHDFNYQVATFDKNGQYILDLAKRHPEIEWVFRPHPNFIEKVSQCNIMSNEEIKNYFSEWEKIGKVYTGGDYYELFNESDALITDCISFLSEYLPTGKPVLHLRKDNQREDFNTLLTQITDTYYKIYDNETLEKIFKEVITQNNDYKKEERLSILKHLMIDSKITTGEKIVKYLKKQLWIKD